MDLRWFLLFAFLSPQLLAGPKVEILKSRFWENGCVAGTADISISADAKRVEVNFDKFLVEADNTLGHTSAKSMCHAEFRIRVPHGFSLAIKRIRYNGVYDLPFGANANLIGEHYFNDEELVVVSKRFYGKSEGPFNMTSRIAYQNLSWTPCGEEAVVRTVTTLDLTARKSVHKASFQIDDRPEHSGISYDLIWRSCKETM
jgi:hypothetical protein